MDGELVFYSNDLGGSLTLAFKCPCDGANNTFGIQQDAIPQIKAKVRFNPVAGNPIAGKITFYNHDNNTKSI